MSNLGNQIKWKYCKRSTFTNSAFTLAETLIALVIIGVVAALVMPGLIANSQKQYYVSRLQKFYSETNQILTKLADDNGSTGDLKGTGLFASGTTDNQTLGDAFVKYFKVSKNCGLANGLNCFPSLTYQYIDKSPSSSTSIDLSGQYNFVTLDGMSVSIYNSSTNCSSLSGTGHMALTCGNVWVDVNGAQGPNEMGRDTFIFWITNAQGPLLYPQGGAETSFWWNASNIDYCSSTKRFGYYCAGRIMEKNWTMDY